MTHTATIARLHFLLGELYAEAVKEASRDFKPALIGLHGQTIFHEGAPVEYLGRRVASTLQIGEAAVVAERTGTIAEVYVQPGDRIQPGDLLVTLMEVGELINQQACVKLSRAEKTMID